MQEKSAGIRSSRVVVRVFMLVRTSGVWSRTTTRQREFVQGGRQDSVDARLLLAIATWIDAMASTDVVLLDKL